MSEKILQKIPTDENKMEVIFNQRERDFMGQILNNVSLKQVSDKFDVRLATLYFHLVNVRSKISTLLEKMFLSDKANN
jgi:ATP/maltotriose-dependent transcriptional regulator MalT